MSLDIPEELKIKYFDVIYEFGFESGKDWSLSAKMKVSRAERTTKNLTIKLHILDKQGVIQQTTVCGSNLAEVCSCAVEWLERYDWVGHSEHLRRGLTGFAIAITNTIAESMSAGKVEVHFGKPG